MIRGVHTMFYTSEPEALRAFFRDKLGFPATDVGEGWLIFGGIASIAFGVLLVINPGSGLLAVVWLVGLYAVIFGIAQIMLGLRLRSLAGESPVSAPVAARAR